MRHKLKHPDLRERKKEENGNKTDYIEETQIM